MPEDQMFNDGRSGTSANTNEFMATGLRGETGTNLNGPGGEPPPPPDKKFNGDATAFGDLGR